MMVRHLDDWQYMMTWHTPLFFLPPFLHPEVPRWPPWLRHLAGCNGTCWHSYPPLLACWFHWQKDGVTLAASMKWKGKWPTFFYSLHDASQSKIKFLRWHTLRRPPCKLYAVALIPMVLKGCSVLGLSWYQTNQWTKWQELVAFHQETARLHYQFLLQIKKTHSYDFFFINCQSIFCKYHLNQVMQYSFRNKINFLLLNNVFSSFSRCLYHQIHGFPLGGAMTGNTCGYQNKHKKIIG